jgi:hypothetical protein
VRHAFKAAVAGVVLACGLSTTAVTAAPLGAVTAIPADVASTSNLATQIRYYGRGGGYGYRSYRSYGYRGSVFGFALAAPVYNCYYRHHRRFCTY